MKKNNHQKNNHCILTKALCFFVILLGVVQVVVANQTAASGINVHLNNEVMEQLEQDNKKLENEIARNTSLSIIEKKALKLGFSRNVSYVFLTESLPFAYHK